MLRFPVMSPKLPKELRDKWKADISSHFESRRQALDLDEQKALEEFDRWWAEDANDGASPPPVPSTTREFPADEHQQNGVSVSNGSSAHLSVPQMVRRIVPEFRDAEFTQGVIKEAILERWPEAEGKYMASRVSTTLKEMTNKGILSRRREGDKVSDPYIYRIVNSREGQLMEP